jgi:uncharacterized protein involved in response to NO
MATTFRPLDYDSSPSWAAFLSYGFRPFFLSAGVSAAAVMALWLAWLASAAAGASTSWLPVAPAPHAWHAHEMVYGFGMAAVAGFLLTAVPNWTGAEPLKGRPLAILFAIWLAGRLALLVSALLPAVLVAAVDLAFVPSLGYFAARQLMVKPARRNMVFLVILAVLTLANAGFHAHRLGLAGGDGLAGVRLGVMMLVVMIAIIGGRIIPAFTHNWLHLNAVAGAMPRKSPRLDAAAIAAVAAYALLDLGHAPATLVAALAALAAGLNAVRLAGWRGWATRSSPIVLVLHVGYAWLVAGLALAALAHATSVVPPVLALHAFGTGAVGTMVLAVMSRAALGHTGRPLAASPAIALSYWLVSLSAASRIIGPLAWPAGTHAALVVSGLVWIAAFSIFAVVYAPILTTPRIRSRG